MEGTLADGGFDGGVEVERLVDLSSGFLILIEDRVAVRESLSI
jgi:hypothetical protein